MYLHASDGIAFTLKVVGYEFPHLETDVYDSNWLKIQIDVSHPNGNWSATSACLLTSEVSQLADWFERFSNGQKVDLSIQFMEPQLQFSFVVVSSRKIEWALRVTMSHAFLPAWAESSEVWVDFPIAMLNLKRASMELREEIKQFPERAAGK